MTKVIFALGIVCLIAGCAGQGLQSAEVEQRDIFDKSQNDAELKRAEAEKQAKIDQEQEELKRQLEEQKRRQEEADSAQTAANEPVIRPLSDDSYSAGQNENDPWAQLDEPGSLLADRSIYYDFDRYDIKDEYVPIIEAHANFLLQHPDIKVRVEGNCDDRGSREYNLALGQRRADSVKRAMTLLGVEAGRIETVSYGAERPVAFEQNEDAWAKNRRSDIIYPDKPK